VVYNVVKLPEGIKDSKVYLWNDFLKLGKDVKDEVAFERIVK
jgi:hypothetical protein